MRKIKSVNTSPEIRLRKALWTSGLRYRLNIKSLPGKPDIVIRRCRLAIFIDGEFWHGYNWKQKKPRIKSNRHYWIPKIERTIERDKINNAKLEALGFTVFRFWEQEIKRDIEGCVRQVIEAINAEDARQGR